MTSDNQRKNNQKSESISENKNPRKKHEDSSMSVREAGKKGGERVRELVEEGKKRENK